MAVTECPRCTTRFRVTDTQLSMAGGRVRCGACLSVFDARDRLEPEAVREMDDEPTELGPAEDVALSAEGTADVGVEDTDETELEVAGDGSSVDEPSAVVDDDIRKEEADPEELGSEGEADAEGEVGAAIDGRHDDDDLPSTPLAARHHTVLLDDARLSAGQRLQLEDLHPEISAPAAAQRPVPVLWSLAAVFLGLLFIAQLGGWYQATWSQRETFRPWYETACGVLGCTLPVRKDLAGVEIQRVVLRNDPEHIERVLVDALLVNTNAQPRVWPILELRISGAHERPLGARRFLPQEYLSGELGGAPSMPARTPVRVSFALRSPGDFVSYRLRVAGAAD